MTAVSTVAFKQAIGMLRRGGTCVLNGLPPGEFPVSIFDVVLNGYTIRGSIVGAPRSGGSAGVRRRRQSEGDHRDAAARIGR